MYYIDEACVLCGKCINDCPVGAISEEDSKYIIGDGCIQCDICKTICPAEAIKLTQSTTLIEYQKTFFTPIFSEGIGINCSSTLSGTLTIDNKNSKIHITAILSSSLPPELHTISANGNAYLYLNENIFDKKIFYKNGEHIVSYGNIYIGEISFDSSSFNKEDTINIEVNAYWTLHTPSGNIPGLPISNTISVTIDK